MKLQLIFLFLLANYILTAQNFTEKPQMPELEGVSIGDIAFSDVNDDGYKDLLISGPSDSAIVAKLYINDGTGNFTEKLGTPFEGGWGGSIAFADVNDDSFEDVLITGFAAPQVLIAKLYLNDSEGNFTEIQDTPFEGVYGSAIAFADVNGDDHKDVLITGTNSASETIAKLYINDGIGNFTEKKRTPFESVYWGCVDFADVNSDGYEDLLITGSKLSLKRITKLYINDGSGNFTERAGIPFEAVDLSSISFEDFNGNGHIDVLISGSNQSIDPSVKLYINDGLGNFTEKPGIALKGLENSVLATSDVNGDGFEDVLISGIKDDSQQYISTLYLNDGLANFTVFPNTPFLGVEYGSMAFADVDNDGKEDVLITGHYISNIRIAKLYMNNGSVSTDFREEVNPDLITFPNPTHSNTLFIKHNAIEPGKVVLRVYNSNGVLVSQQKEIVVIGQQGFSIDIENLYKGNYFVELDDGDLTITAKFIVQ